MDLKVGRVLEVERVPNTDKLYQSQIDIGAEEPVQVVSGIVPYYDAEQLEGKLVVVVANLKPSTIAGARSEAMVLCAHNEENDQCLLVEPEKDIEPGTKVV